MYILPMIIMIIRTAHLGHVIRVELILLNLPEIRFPLLYCICTYPICGLGGLVIAYTGILCLIEIKSRKAWLFI